jgi:hypothetical protein
MLSELAILQIASIRDTSTCARKTRVTRRGEGLTGTCSGLLSAGLHEGRMADLLIWDQDDSVTTNDCILVRTHDAYFSLKV